MVKKSKAIINWCKELLQKYILHILVVGTASSGLVNEWLKSRISLPEKVEAINKLDNIQGNDIKILNEEMKAIKKILELHDSQIINIQKANTKARAKPKPRIKTITNKQSL